MHKKETLSNKLISFYHFTHKFIDLWEEPIQDPKTKQSQTEKENHFIDKSHFMISGKQRDVLNENFQDKYC